MTHPSRTLAGLLLLLGGCFSTPVTEKTFYDLALPSAADQGIGKHRIAIGTVSASPGYDTDLVAYRVRDNELHYYGYKRWVTEPPKLLAEAIARHLRASKYFDRVDSDERLNGAHGLLEANIEAIEEVDQGKKTFARLAMSFVLRATDSDTILMRHVFDESRPCKRDPHAVAQEIGQLLRLQMKSLAKRAAEALARRAGKGL